MVTAWHLLGISGSPTEPEHTHIHQCLFKWKLIKDGSCVKQHYNPNRSYRLRMDLEQQDDPNQPASPRDTVQLSCDSSRTKADGT